VNGAGKSTTISIICGQNNKDSGDVLVLGKDITKDRDEITRKIGVVFQNSHLDKKLNAFDNLKSRAALYGIYGEAFKKRFDELAELLDFKDFIKRPLEKLSGGQKRRIDIARALFHNPEILILDEPTTGLDPQTRKLLWNVINNLRKEKNLTVFLTTHYMEEASESDYVVILNKGEVAAEGTPIELKNKYSSDYITIYNSNNIPDFGYPVEQFKDYIRIKVPNTKAATDLLLKHPDYFTDYEITKGKMDDVFLTVTGSNAMEENI
jgi:multidrug/hemolysin transport system ATP-binding protein